MDTFEKSKRALGKYIQENYDKVKKDIGEMLEKSKDSDNMTFGEYLESMRGMQPANKYYMICYSGKSRSEARMTYWNEVTDKSISEWFISTRESFKKDEYYMEPVVHSIMEISEKDFNNLDGIVG